MERHWKVIFLLRQASVLLFVEVAVLSLEALLVFLLFCSFFKKFLVFF